MPKRLPKLNLSFGQMLWAVRYGQEASQGFRDQTRYLRLLDIPAAATRKAEGPGNRIRYGFHDLMELGLAVTALDLGFRPKDIAEGLVNKRKDMRRVYVKAWHSLPDAALTAAWIKSRGAITPILLDEFFIRLHDRHSHKWGEVDFINMDEANAQVLPFGPVERFGTEAPRLLLPLKRLMLQWVYWAQDAPDIKPGRR